MRVWEGGGAAEDANDAGMIWRRMGRRRRVKEAAAGVSRDMGGRASDTSGAIAHVLFIQGGGTGFFERRGGPAAAGGGERWAQAQVAAQQEEEDLLLMRSRAVGIDKR